MKRSVASLVVCGLMILMTAPAPGQGVSTRYMRGVVRYSASGKPAPFVWVLVRQGGAEKGRSLTGDDGSYFIRNLPDGLYDLVVTKGTRTLYQGRAELPRDKILDIPLRTG
jgi:hypothetical protein